MISLTLALPPLTQLNTPYPSTAYLAQFLRERGIECKQRDLGLKLVLRLFSRTGLEEIFATLEGREELPEPAWRTLALSRQHLQVIEPVIEFLQGRQFDLAPRIVETPFLPSGPQLARANLDQFGPLGISDAARHLATLYLEDLADLITACIDPGFGLARYQHHLALGAQSFTPLLERLSHTTLVDRHLDALADGLDSEVVGLSVPFPGNLYAALRIGGRLRKRGIYVLLGGGYVNTELRDVDEPRLWNFVDALTYDDGEGPLLAILEHLSGGKDERHRTRTSEGLLEHAAMRPTMTLAGTYDGLDLTLYLQMIDTLNPAHRLWADGRWNKITLAHGCYWQRCTFCDVSLDYISHYEAAEVGRLVEHIERLIEETGQRGFHFVDEAAPPSVLKALAIALLERNLGISFWGNIRFEKAFTPDLCRLLAAAGLIAVTGGLEVANERLLEAIDKGVTVAQVANAAAAFRGAGVMVHAYLMYGFPSETEQETIDGMELVRQLFEADLINSAFWHRFVLTRHAPIFADPTRYGVEIKEGVTTAFARNDVSHLDPSGANHDLFDDVLPLALADWLKGEGLDLPVGSWFDVEMPDPRVAPNQIELALERTPEPKQSRLLWLGGTPYQTEDGLVLHTPDAEALIPGESAELRWLEQILLDARPGEPAIQLSEAKSAFPGDWRDFAGRWKTVREIGLVLI